MGRLKQLLPLGDKPVVRHCLETLIESGIEETAVVIGPQGTEIPHALAGLPVKIACNERAGEEMADSVRTGLKVLAGSSSGVLIVLSDHPLVSPRTIEALVSAHSEAPDKIIIPRYEGRNGHPTLFPKKIILEAFDGITLRQIRNSDPDRVKYIDIADRGVILDMDTIEDYKRIHEAFKNQRIDR